MATYQSPYTYQPRFGFRYSGSDFAPPTSPINTPHYTMDIPKYKAPAKPISTTNSSAVMGTDGEHDNSSAANSTQLSLDQANKDINDIRVPDQIKGNLMHSPEFNPMALVPGLGTVSGLMGDSIPKSGFGADGTYSSITGGKFDGGKSYDPITGYANPEYSTMGAFKDNFMSDPMGNLTGDPDNAFNYSKNDPTKTNSNMAQGFEFAMTNSPLGKDADGMTQEDKNLIAKKIGLDMGIDESSLGDNSATTDAIQGLGYSDTGAATPGSQFSSTGTFSTPSSSPAGNSNESGEHDHSDTTDDYSMDSWSDDGWSDEWSQGGLIPALGMNKRNRDIPHPIMQDPLAGFI